MGEDMSTIPMTALLGKEVYVKGLQFGDWQAASLESTKYRIFVGRRVRAEQVVLLDCRTPGVFREWLVHNS